MFDINVFEIGILAMLIGGTMAGVYLAFRLTRPPHGAAARRDMT
ncbi:MAG: hypothetical protein ABI720_04110 [Actinomycetes bacterium]